MRHLDDAELADIALRGLVSLDPESQQHVEHCPDCSDEAAAYVSVGSAARSGEPLDAPPPGLWERIVNELGEELPPEASTPDPRSRPRPAEHAVPEAESPEAPQAGERQGAAHPVPAVTSGEHPTRRRARGMDRRGDSSRPGTRSGGRRRTRGWMAGAAVVGFVLGAAVVVGIGQTTGRTSSEVVEQAQLEPLPGWDARGTARVEDTAGRLQLVVDLPEGKVSGYREVWLLDLGGQSPGLLSVGTLTGDQGVFDLPPGVDLAKFSIVDVSDEPLDGDPAHSTKSIVRGELGPLG